MTTEYEKNEHEIRYAFYDSPIGIIRVAGTEEFIVSVHFDNKIVDWIEESTELLKNCIRQLDEYFLKERQQFDLPLKIEGTTFQKQVWEEVQKVPFGKTASYLEIAEKVNNPKAVRAVGNANRTNPIVIIIPCHRIIGSDGSLTGYGGGIYRKEWLLKHELKSLENISQ